LGKPVIATNYSGNLGFMNDDNSYLIDVSGIEKIDSEMCNINPNYDDQEWAVISESDLRKKMLYVYDNRKEAKQIGAVASKHIADNFSYKKISDQIIDILEKF
ncbi:MAG: hypothetical protein Q7R95_07070, partial [bacterium]|nr:hypothetical protein [bacterium]